jgi:hypothetical protein
VEHLSDDSPRVSGLDCAQMLDWAKHASQETNALAYLSGRLVKRNKCFIRCPLLVRLSLAGQHRFQNKVIVSVVALDDDKWPN